MNTPPPPVKVLTSFSGWLPSRRHLHLLLALGCVSLGAQGSLGAATYWWDTNGSTTGATNGTAADGTWGGANSLWTTNSAGTSSTTTYTSASDAVFSAGTNATGASTVTLGSQIVAASITIEEGIFTFSGSLSTPGGNTLILRKSDASTITLGANAHGSATFNSLVTLGNTYPNQTFENLNTTAGRDLIFNGAILNGNAATAHLTLSSAGAGGITVNAAIGGKYSGGNPSGADPVMNVTVNSAGSGATTFNGVNVYTGLTQVTAGTLVTGSAGSINTSSGVSVNGSTAVFRHDSSVALTKTVTFGASGGTFLYNSSAKYTGGSGSILANADDTLGGSGALGHVTIASGGTLTPGSLGNGNTGQLTVDSLTLQSGAQSQFDIFSAALFDSIQSTGTKTLGGSLLLKVEAPLADATIIDLFTGGTPGSLTGNFDSISISGSYLGNFSLVGGVYQFNTGSQLLTFDHVAGELSFSTIPEPSASLLAAGCPLVALFLRRRRKEHGVRKA